MKKYPLKIEELDSDEHPLFSRGHQDEFAFVTACTPWGYRLVDIRASYQWWRCAPPGHHPDYDVFYVPGEQGKRGSFPVTALDFSYERVI